MSAPAVRLVALDAGQVRRLAAGRSAEVAGRQVCWPEDDRRVLRYRAAALDADPQAAPWLLHVLLDGCTVAARIGCHEAPRDGTVEVGYRVGADRRGRGLGTLVVTEFLRWLGDRGVERVRAAVRPDNAPSRALLDRLGFTPVGEQWDDEDGLELVLELALDRSGGPAPARPLP